MSRIELKPRSRYNRRLRGNKMNKLNNTDTVNKAKDVDNRQLGSPDPAACEDRLSHSVALTRPNRYRNCMSNCKSTYTVGLGIMRASLDDPSQG